MITLNKGASLDSVNGYKFVPKYDHKGVVYSKAPTQGAYDLIVEHCSIAKAVASSPLIKKGPNWRLIGGVAAGVAVVGTTAVVVVKQQGARSIMKMALGGTR